MAEFERPQVLVCPYWQKYAVSINGDSCRILALCGRAGNQGSQFSEADIGLRVKKCPYYTNGGNQAYNSPTIMEIFDDGDVNYTVTTRYKGIEGIRDLEWHWPYELIRFQSDCDKEVENDISS